MADPRNGRGHRAYRRQRAALKNWAIRNGLTHCPGCGAEFDFENLNTKHGFTADHPDALANGGALLGQQLAPLCRSCNARKGNSVTPTLRNAT